MIFTIDQILRDARRLLQLPAHEDPLLGAECCHGLTVDEAIRCRVLDAVAAVHQETQPQWLEAGHQLDGEVFWHGSDLWGWILLPPDFMRIVAFEMSDWSRPVHAAIDSDSALYELQRSPYAGLRGSPARPVCALAHRSEGLALEFYSCRSQEAYPVTALYLPWPKWESGGVDISEHCYPAVLQRLVTSITETKI